MYVVDGNNLSPDKCKPVQTEVQYTPEIDWIAYDISYKTEEDPEKQGTLYIINYNLYVDCINYIMKIFGQKSFGRKTSDEKVSDNVFLFSDSNF